MGQLRMGHLTVQDGNEGTANVGKAILGGVGGGLVMGLLYGLASKFVGEYQYAAFLVGAVTGLAAMKLGGGRSIVGGVVAAVTALVGIVLGKLIFLAPEGVSFMDAHMTLFDILFCYVANPAAAFFAAGTDKARFLLNKLPI